MAATKFGLGNYGIKSEQDKGLFIESLAITVQMDTTELPNNLGDTVGTVHYNETATITGSGATVTANDTGQTIGGILVINSTSLYGVADTTSVDQYFVENVELTNSNTEFQVGNFTARGFGGISGASATNVTGP